MQKTTSQGGDSLISCTNHACGSNGGDNFSAVQQLAAKEAACAEMKTILENPWDSFVEYHRREYSTNPIYDTTSCEIYVERAVERFAEMVENALSLDAGKGILERLAKAEKLLGEALDSFKITQEVTQYPKDHWCNKTETFLNEKGGV